MPPRRRRPDWKTGDWWIGLAIVAAALLGMPGLVAAKMRPVAPGSFEGVPPAVAIGVPFDVVLRLLASRDSPDVTAEIVLPAGGQVAGRSLRWTGALRAGQPVDVPLSLWVTAEGEHRVLAEITNRLPGEVQVSRPILNVLAEAGVARLGADSHFLMKLARASTLDGLRGLGLAVPQAPRSAPSGLPRITTEVNGTVLWQDLDGHAHPVRFAFLRIRDGETGDIVFEGRTESNGRFSAPVTAATVRIQVFSKTFDDPTTITVITPGLLITSNYTLDHGPVPASPTPLEIKSAKPVRNGPDSEAGVTARAFSVLDAVITYWAQATTLLGRNMDPVVVIFPNVSSGLFFSPCPGISCFGSGRLHVSQFDALDWDVIGHELFHQVTQSVNAGGRQIDSSPGGFHDGYSAIGQGPGDGGTGTPRTREEGMALAWSEGLTTFMPVALQVRPVAGPFGSLLPFPSDLRNVGDAIYQDTEDASITTDPESPLRSDGFGSERSVLGVLWDLVDGLRDSSIYGVSDITDNTPVLTVWQAITAALDCNPCDQVGRLWEAVAKLFGDFGAAQGGPLSPSTLTMARVFALNEIGPTALGVRLPNGQLVPDGGSVGGGIRPTFFWRGAGDPSPSHQNDTFFLVFSRDGFQAHKVIVPVTQGASEHQPTEDQWREIQAGGTTGDLYEWLVTGKRGDAPSVPGLWVWYSNTLKLKIRSLHARITWAPLGADVDLHLSSPSGQEISYSNPSPGWGALDRDCITTCSEENISVDFFPEPGAYQLYAVYFSDHGLGPALVHAEVFDGGEKIVDISFGLSDGESRAIATALVGSQKPEGRSPVTVTGSPDLRGWWGGPRPPKPPAGP